MRLARGKRRRHTPGRGKRKTRTSCVTKRRGPPLERRKGPFYKGRRGTAGKKGRITYSGLKASLPTGEKKGTWPFRKKRVEDLVKEDDKIPALREIGFRFTKKKKNLPSGKRGQRSLLRRKKKRENEDFVNPEVLGLSFRPKLGK